MSINHKIGIGKKQNRGSKSILAFNVFEMGTEESVHRAFDVLRDGSVVIEAIHEVPWSKCCAAFGFDEEKI